jgi:hypothetical protein
MALPAVARAGGGLIPATERKERGRIDENAERKDLLHREGRLLIN